MHPKKRTFIFLLSLLLCLSMLLPACTQAGITGNDTDPVTDAPATEPPVTEPLPDEGTYLSVENLKGALIVYPENADASLADAAKALQAAISEKFGVRVNTMVDYFKAFNPEKSVKEYEILIGYTDRAESKSYADTLPYFDYGWGLVNGKKIAILGGTDELTVQAVDAFIDALEPSEAVFYRASSDCVYHAEYEYPYADLSIGTKPVSEYAILYGGKSGEALWESATVLRNTIGALTGHILPMMSTTLAEVLGVSEDTTALLVGAEGYGSYDSAFSTLALAEASYLLTDTEKTTQLAFVGETFYTVDMAIDAFWENLLGEGETVMQPAAGEIVRVRTADYYIADPLPTREGYPVGKISIAGNDLSLYRIVYGTNEGKAAAEDLASYLYRACGVTVPVVSDEASADETPYEIVIGVTNRDTEEVTERRAALKNDGYLRYVQGERLFISSHTSYGQFTAVTHFLEEKIGVRFYTNYRSEDVILVAEEIAIPADLDESYCSPFFYRLSAWPNNDIRQRFAINGFDPKYVIVGHSHTMEALAGVPQTEQPCLTDETVYQTVLANLRVWIEQHPDSTVFSVTQNDNQEYCTCEKCTALAEEEGQSGVMLSFVNRLYDDLKDEYPDIYLLTFAYEYTRQPPKTIKASDHVIIWLCSIECCFIHDLDDPSCPENAAFMRDIQAWQDYTDYLYVWDYTSNFAEYNTPFPDLFTLRKNAGVYADHHVIGLYESCQGNISFGEFTVLRTYLINHLLWDPYISEEDYQAMIDEYLAQHYGAGWKYVRHYLELVTEIAQKNHMYIFEFIHDNYLGNTGVSYDYLVSLWDRAIALAEDETTRNHCRYSSIQARLMKEGFTLNSDLHRLMWEAGIRQTMLRVDMPAPN